MLSALPFPWISKYGRRLCFDRRKFRLRTSSRENSRYIVVVIVVIVVVVIIIAMPAEQSTRPFSPSSLSSLLLALPRFAASASASPAAMLVPGERLRPAEALPAPPANERFLPGSAVPAMHAAPVPSASFRYARRTPAAVLAEMRTAASAFRLAAVLAAVASDAAHAAPPAARHGTPVLEAPFLLRIAAVAPARHKTASSGVEGGKRDALASVVPAHGALGSKMGGLMIKRRGPGVSLEPPHIER